MDRNERPRPSEPVRESDYPIATMLAHIEDAVRPYPKAALFELAKEGHRTVFEQLIACIFSIRTRDEVTLPLARRFFARARTPAEVAALSVDEIRSLIRPSIFSFNKAPVIATIAHRAETEFGGALPCDRDVLLSFKGVGIKCAHLTLAIACGEPHVAVDVHVHRVTNRWGYVATTTPERTTAALEVVLPREHWIDINRLLVPFGKHVCTGALPRCSTCPVLKWCRRVGVVRSR